jgi:hypothetical protein
MNEKEVWSAATLGCDFHNRQKSSQTEGIYVMWSTENKRI